MEVTIMKIASSDISMSSAHNYTETNIQIESMNLWVDEGTKGRTLVLSPDILEISDQGKKMQFTDPTQLNPTDQSRESEFELSDKDKRTIELIEAFFEHVLGKKIKITIPKSIKFHENNIKIDISGRAQQAVQQAAQQRAGWGLTYNASSFHSEKESTSFNAAGSIKTTDGREINIDMNLLLSREYTTNTNISIRAGDAAKVDPLVINYDSSTAHLKENKYAFDLDSDGKMDQISFLGEGSGFLALDKNNDNIINDGSELFGPQSGNGFSDLAEYDNDQNGWIDENDAIYEKLRIWSKDSQGNDTLVALGQKGIGAIYLGNINTSFSLNGSQNQQNGQLQKTGIFLRENGTAGTVQHIDLTV